MDDTKEVNTAPSVSDVNPEGIPEEEKTSTSAPDKETAETLLAGKYKSPEELEKAYKEAEKKISELGSEASRLRQKSALIDKVVEKYKEFGYSEEEALGELEKISQITPGEFSPEDMTERKLKKFERELLLTKREIEISKFLEKQPEAKHFEGELKELVARYPDSSVDEIYHRFFGKAFQLAKELSSKEREIKEENSAKTSSIRTGGRTLTPEEIKKLPLEEQRKVIGTV